MLLLRHENPPLFFLNCTRPCCITCIKMLQVVIVYFDVVFQKYLSVHSNVRVCVVVNYSYDPHNTVVLNLIFFTVVDVFVFNTSQYHHSRHESNVSFAFQLLMLQHKFLYRTMIQVSIIQI